VASKEIEQRCTGTNKLESVSESHGRAQTILRSGQTLLGRGDVAPTSACSKKIHPSKERRFE
jgi:hypothetical protein